MRVDSFGTTFVGRSFPKFHLSDSVWIEGEHSLTFFIAVSNEEC